MAHGEPNLSDATFKNRVGEVTASPTANTVLARLKSIADSVAAIDTDTTTVIGHVDGIETLLTAIDGRVDGIEALLTTIDADTGSILTSVDGIEGLLTTIDADTGSILTSVDGIEALLTTIDADTGNIDTSLNNIETSATLLDDVIFTDDSAFSVATHKVSAIGFLADETATDSVDEGDIGIPRMTLDRKVITTSLPHTAGGWLTFNATSGDGSTALTNSAQAIKASAGQLGGWYIYNPNSVVAYVILYNTAAASVTVGTTNPKMVLAIPATAAANIEISNGIEFTNAGFSAAAVMTTAGGNTAPTVALEANFLYK